MLQTPAGRMETPMSKEQISPEVLALLRINGLIMDGLIKSGAIEASWFVDHLDRLAREEQHGLTRAIITGMADAYRKAHAVTGEK